MANEMTTSGSMTYLDANNVTEQMSYTNQQTTVSGLNVIHGQLSVTTSEVAIPLGSLASIGWATFRNLDATNYIEIRVGTGSTKMLRVPAGKAIGPLYFGSGVTAPYAIADTATCKMEYEISSQ